jgi:CobN/Magnesium Chelatase
LIRDHDAPERERLPAALPGPGIQLIFHKAGASLNQRRKVAARNIDSPEHDIADSDDYFPYPGGMVATIRTLAEETTRVCRARAVNPRRIRPCGGTVMRRSG